MIEAIEVCVDNGVRKPIYLYSVIENAIAFKMPPRLAWEAKKASESTPARYQIKDNKKGPVRGEKGTLILPPPPDPIPPPVLAEHVAIWETAKSQVRNQMTGATFDTLFKDAQPIERENGTFELRVKPSALEMIEHRPKVKANILAALQAVKPEIHSIDFEVIKQ